MTLKEKQCAKSIVLFNFAEGKNGCSNTFLSKTKPGANFLSKLKYKDTLR